MCKFKVHAMFGGRRTVPLGTILQKCLAHIDSLEASRSVCDYYEKEFQELKQFSESLKTQPEFACTEGEKEFNRKKNRYKDILPFNSSRVILSEVDGIKGSNYINANYIKGASRSPAYIASQGPLPNTINDFWRMIVECEVQVIVMACNAEEAGKVTPVMSISSHKCENYWVEREGDFRSFGMVEITLLKAKSICPDFLVRTMRLQYKNDRGVTEKRTMYQFHYSAWPDHGVPPLVRPLLDMVRLVRDTQASETLPVLVHCSAGCGRTGTICAIDFVWGLLRLGKLSEDFSLYNLVRDMRMQRVAMVQTKEQYMLVHQAVRELFKEQMKIIDSHLYENLSKTSQPIFQDSKDPIYETLLLTNSCDEKKDETKGDKLNMSSYEYCHKNALPLPKKKYPSVACSKLEKEVENLTEKNRIASSLKEAYMDESGNSLNRKPKITKLKALFERGTVNTEKNCPNIKHSITRCHSMGPIRRPVLEAIALVKSEAPIQNAGKLKVPKLMTSSRPVSQVKRSKSLKIAKEPVQLLSLLQCPMDDDLDIGQSSMEKQGYTAFPKLESNSIKGQKYEVSSKIEQNLDSRRRRSLESLIGEHPPEITWPSTMKKLESQRSSETPKVKPHLSFKHQLQLLSSASQRTMNSLASGLGIRERRNSFRQAVNKDETLDRANLQFGSEGRFVSVPEDGTTSVFVNSATRPEMDMLTVRSQNGEILRPKLTQHSYDSQNVLSDLSDTPKIPKQGIIPLRSNPVRRHPSSNSKEVKISSQSMRLPSKNRFLFKLKTELQNNSESSEFQDRNCSSEHLKISSPKLSAAASDGDVVDGKSKTLPSSPSKFYITDHSFMQSIDRKLHSPGIVRPSLRRSPAFGSENINIKDTTTSYVFSQNELPLKSNFANKTPPFKYNDDLYPIYNTRLNNGPQFIRLGKSSSASSQSSDNLSDYQKKSALPDDGKDSSKKYTKPHSDFCRLASDRLRQDLSSESSSSSGARELNSVMSRHQNYKSNSTGYGNSTPHASTSKKSTSASFQFLSRPDPVAPPRARRRSEKLSIACNHGSPESLVRSTTSSSSSYIESKEWHGALGVDLDKVAASLHRGTESNSGVAGAMRGTSDSEKVYFAAVPSNLRKQQYL